MEFGTLITAMVTPFDEQLQVDWPQVEKLIDYLIEEQKSDSLVVCGTTGESPTLTDEEKVKLFEVSVRHARGRCKIIAGTGSYDTADSIRMTKLAAEAGVDGILLVSPYYNKPSQEGLYQHFKAIAESTRLPIMLYNIPGRTGVNIEPDTMLRLAQIPNIFASKEAHSDLDHVSKLVREAPDGFKIYSGDDSYTLPFLAVGSYGIVSVSSHVVGKEMKEMIEFFGRGEVKKAALKHAELLPVFRGMFECPHKVPNPAPVKHALNVKGIRVGGVRLPLVPVTEEEGRYIEALL
ncbi:4-hydroxy-tetrahydrodipicolinate synthase [Paenibacillus sp. J2TS4]|uniref:4-hydroxy-tetrahydrodipicolinate synthase n=1 Tax=Paenibacillus sp. J2TS4 TaxID=2807194 RepID=UPI001AFD7F7A|nr:4-hydroxy-tetrahydrodipicolinate synthase [Paenibacillus sp. J2TS4]GIP33127.1 4-hydroxy-tetrahydrodipicolinate synthase [Paenibacillus sp. J2TS4]